MIGEMAKTGNRAGTTVYMHNKRMRLTSQSRLCLAGDAGRYASERQKHS